jgi:hypothetical protein
MDPATTSPSESSQSLFPSRNEENDDSGKDIVNREGYENHQEYNSLSTFQSRSPHDRSDIFTYNDRTLISELPTSNCLSKHTDNSFTASSDTDSSDNSLFADYDSQPDGLTKEVIEEGMKSQWVRQIFRQSVR